MKFKAKVNGKVIYDDPIGVTSYTMLLETGDYITFRVKDSDEDKIILNIGDKATVNVAKGE
ncbi:hypothetical protein H6A05_01850 [Megasphaera elsdenii]|uniref:hypothetical protein n=1 Tax=Megasphaera elsdenii TaxID=907 RepID=UPI00195AB0C8|nr:hypothetical protein [Megasphaera elsdenii]MBM6701072.1 hypothetical protein [Megasphaera elsdenii]